MPRPAFADGAIGLSRSIHEARPHGDAQLSLTMFPGLDPAIGLAPHPRTTLRSIGRVVMTLTAAPVAALTCVLIDFGILALSVVPGPGLSRSPVRRRRSGQSDIDGVKAWGLRRRGGATRPCNVTKPSRAPMQNVVLVIHLLLALSLIAIVLLQRSEGGGLGMGGGGGGGGFMTGRQAANALSRMTWVLAVAFIATSLVLTVLTARQAGESSVAGALAPDGQEAGESGAAPSGDDLLPPAPDGGGTSGPAAPPPADSPVTPPAAE